MTIWDSYNPFYDQLHQRWREINETHTEQEIATLTFEFLSGLGFQRAILFIHDDETGLFKATFQHGYELPAQLQALNVSRLLLSGAIVQTLRTTSAPLIHTPNAPNALVHALLDKLSLSEALLSKFGGDVEVPHGIIVIGNNHRDPPAPHPWASVTEPATAIALQNLILHLSNAVNTSTYYRAWGNEKKFLSENIELRTQEIREQKEKFEAIYQTSKDGIAILDVHTTAFLNANPAFLEMMGYSLTQLQRTSCLAITIESDLQASHLAVAQVRQKGFVQDFVKTCTTQSGQPITLNMSLALMHDDQRILLTAKDMTQRYQLERELLDAKNKAERSQSALEQKNQALEDLTFNLETIVAKRTEELEKALAQAQNAAQAKSQFLASMSHEIRTPINGVLGMAELLSSTPLTTEQNQLLKVLHSSGQSLLAIVNDILDFSKIEAGKLELENRPFNLANLLDEIKEVFELQAHARDLEFSMNYPTSLPALMLGDTMRLRQIFANLISNAIKFTPQGHVTVSVSGTQEPGRYLACVSDSGIGLSAQSQAKIFKPFVQANATTTRQFGGTGLGLVISETLVQLMGGKIWLRSEEGVGSHFFFTFDAPAAENQVLLNAVHAEKSARIQDLSHLNVLVVEDHQINRMLIVKLLEKLAIKPDVAHDGLEALQCVQANTYDVILMDMQMPNMDGVTATQAIRTNLDFHQPHIVALTANAFAEDRERCFAAGMNDFISKPVGLKTLSASLLKAFAAS